MLFFLYLYLSINPPKVSWVQKNKKAAQLSPILIINQHITMISEGSCYTEDWNNDDENSALHHRNKLYLKVY